MKLLSALIGASVAVSSAVAATNVLEHVSFTNTVGMLVEIDVVEATAAGLQYRSKKGPGLYRWNDLPTDVADVWRPRVPVVSNHAASAVSAEDESTDTDDAAPVAPGASRCPSRPNTKGKDVLSIEYLNAWRSYYARLTNHMAMQACVSTDWQTYAGDVKGHILDVIACRKQLAGWKSRTMEAEKVLRRRSVKADVFIRSAIPPGNQLFDAYFAIEDRRVAGQSPTAFLGEPIEPDASSGIPEEVRRTSKSKRWFSGSVTGVRQTVVAGSYMFSQSLYPVKGCEIKTADGSIYADCTMDYKQALALTAGPRPRPGAPPVPPTSPVNSSDPIVSAPNTPSASGTSAGFLSGLIHGATLPVRIFGVSGMAFAPESARGGDYKMGIALGILLDVSLIVYLLDAVKTRRS